MWQPEKTLKKDNLNGRVSVVIPAKNEETTICRVIQKVSSFADEILVIDGHSTDKTREAASKLGATVILDNGKGKGAGLRQGIKAATGDILVFIDADGSHEAEDIPKLITPIAEGNADMVVASRLRGGSDEFHGTFDNVIRMFGGALVTLAIRKKWKAEITDCENGYRAIRRDVALSLELKRDDFVIEQEMVVNCLKMGYKVCEVPSHEYERQGGTSKLKTTQGWKFIWHLTREIFSPNGKIKT